MTITTFTSNNVNTLAEVTFIGGTFRELYFHTYTSASTPIDLTYQPTLWVLSPYSQPDYISLSKSGVGYNGYFYVPLLSTDTIILSGKYIQKATILGVNGYTYKLGQGIINIIPAGGV